ncbi:MAG: exonuclease SbcCD subunit D C-terminal domain-containing protein, partial [bacterium]|nr:exonuclease SbcCD subunit D C-terminal domain-containing protein [bacterium]
SSCRHVVVIAGNHDSPSFLNAPKELLKALNVHVVGNASEAMVDEVLVLRNEQDAPELIVCAVPYLRDRDIRLAEVGESIEDKERKLIEGIRNHYAVVADLAQQKRRELGVDIPIVGMGHLFTAGGQTVDGDGVRELYVGSLAHVTAGIFPECLDYVALGHLHVPQRVGGSEIIRYSGSPLPMGFGEATQQKIVCQVEFRREPGFRRELGQCPEDSIEANKIWNRITVQLIDVPVLQKLECIKGDLDGILTRIRELSAACRQDGSSVWLEVLYEGSAVIGDLRERLEAEILGTAIEILRIKNNRIIDRIMGRVDEEETLDDLNVNEVFERCLAVHDLPEEQRLELCQTYREAISSLHDDDLRAE